MGSIILKNNTLIKILKKNREKINKKVDIARQKNPKIDLDAISYGFQHVFEPLISIIEKEDHKDVENVFNIIFEFFLYAVSKRYYALPKKQFTSVRMELLFNELLPLIPEILLKSAFNSIGKLINAGENLRNKSIEFYSKLVKIAKVGCLNSDNLSDVGVVIAWSVGEIRLRKHALDIIEKLSPHIIKTLMDLEKVSDSVALRIAPFVSSILSSHKWRPLSKPFSNEFIDLIQKGQKITQNIIENELKSPSIINQNELILLGDVGGFYGFGGWFKTTPRIVWGPDSTIIAYTSAGDSAIIYLDGNGNKIKKLISTELKILSYHPEIGFIGVNSNGDIINLTNNKKYPEKIVGTRKIFDFCSSFTTLDSIFIIHKEKEIFKITSTDIKKIVFRKKYNGLTVSSDNRLFFIDKISNSQGSKSYYLFELTFAGKTKKIMKIALNGHLKVSSNYAYIFREPNKLVIYNLNNSNEMIIKKFPVDLKKCSSFLINESEIYITLKYSYHILCFGPDPHSI